MDLDQIWKTALGELEIRLTNANFGMWFKDSFILDVKDETITVASPNAFTRDWIRDKYNKEIFLTLKKLLPAIKEVEYKVASRGDAKNRKIAAPPPPVKNTPSSGFQNCILGESYTFERFVVGNTNRFAYAAAEAVSEKPGKIHNPLFIYGGVGLGKTHLAQAIGNEIKCRNKNKKIVYVTCETFTNDFVTSISSGKMKEFKKNYREIDVLIVDDIQFLANKEGSQEEFFHTYNTLHQTNRQIVVTADRPPKGIPNLEERLKSRFGSGLLTDIQPPDLETRLAILKAKTIELNAKCPEDVLLYIAQNIRTNIRELTGALNKISTHAGLYHEEPTISLCNELLKDMFTPTVGKTSVERIMTAISKYYNIPLSDIISKKRFKLLSNARQIAMYLLRHELGLSYSLIGKELGGRDHSTILHGAEKIEKFIIRDDSLKKEITSIRERIHSVV